MPSDFWGGWIAVITLVTLIALGWLVFSVYFSNEPVRVADETWDGTLREGAAPAPLWWFWLILALMAVSVLYLMLYPGLGTFRGALRWSQGGQIAASMAQYDERFGPERARLAQASFAELRSDARAMRSAASLFAVHCAACHGEDRQGQANLFPNLVGQSWQWSGAESAVLQTLTAGRQAIMPPWQAVLGDDGVAEVADYVSTLRSPRVSNEEPMSGAAGEQAFRAYCSACHGIDGSGVPALGAPALNDDIWVYGGTQADLRESIASGRNGVMPAFGDRLDTAQLRLLTAWLTRD
jgi:cytochrome c oxidase cbb3-type subunit III